MAIKRTTGHNTFGGQGRFLLAFLLVLSLLAMLFFTACSQMENNNSKPALSTSSHEYAETIIDGPGGFFEFDSLEKTNSGKLWLVEKGHAFGNLFPVLWEFGNDNTWKEIVNIGELLALDESACVLASAISKNNKVLCFIVNYADDSSAGRFYAIDPDLESGYRELNVDTSALLGKNGKNPSYNLDFQLSSLKNDHFFVQYGYNSSFILDTTNETIKRVTLGEGDIWWRFLGAAEAGETLYALYEDMAAGYSAKTNTLDALKMLPWVRESPRLHSTTKLSTLDASTGNFNDINNKELASLLDEYGSNGPLRVASTIKADYEPVERITICLSGALIEYNNGGIGKIIYAEDTILSDTSKEILGHVFDNEDDFFLLCRDYLTAEIFLYKYEKIADEV